jgi:hypothetical protein
VPSNILKLLLHFLVLGTTHWLPSEKGEELTLSFLCLPIPHPLSPPVFLFSYINVLLLALLSFLLFINNSIPVELTASCLDFQLLRVFGLGYCAMVVLTYMHEAVFNALSPQPPTLPSVCDPL